MTTFDKLKIRVKKDLNIDLENFERLYVGHWQRSQGAWVWMANYKGSTECVGSTESATDLIKSEKNLFWLPKDRGLDSEICSQ
jgi:hypothetical protein